jgi:uncharacterized glyoxalase superfamily protein PhnB
MDGGVAVYSGCTCVPHGEVWMSKLGNLHGRSSIVPTLRYRDVDGAVTWLSTAFGFVEHTVLRGADGKVSSAQLVHGSGMIILAPVGDSEFDELMRQPDEIGGAETQSSYFIVDDADAHYATAKAAGADIVLDLQSFEHGGRGYLCRDPEGHLWSFGTFDPWAGNTLAAPAPRFSLPQLAGLSPRQGAWLAGIPLLILAGTVVALAWWSGGAPEGAVTRQALQAEQSARAEAERKAGTAEAELARLRREQEAGELDSDKLQEQIAHLAGAKDKAETAHKTTEAAIRKLAEQVSQLQLAKATAERAIRHLTARSVRDRQTVARSRRRATALSATIAAQTDAAQRSAGMLQGAQARLDAEIAARKAAEASRSRIEQLLAEEREAKAQAETGLQQVSEQLKQEQAARRAAELAQESGPVPAPRPAIRPDR